MFFSSLLFTKKSGLSKLWLAAHHQDKKLSKNVVLSTNIESCSTELCEPSAPLALRLSGQLLLGVVRIYQRKVRYLQEDCSEALTRIKLSFRPGLVDLPANLNAHQSSITMIDQVDFDLFVPDIPLSRLDELELEQCDESMENFRQQDLTLQASTNIVSQSDLYGFDMSQTDHGNFSSQMTHIPSDYLIGNNDEEDLIAIEPLETFDDQSEVMQGLDQSMMDDDLVVEMPVEPSAVAVSDSRFNPEAFHDSEFAKPDHDNPTFEFDDIDEPLIISDHIMPDLADESVREDAGLMDIDDSIVLNVKEFDLPVAKTAPRKRKRDIVDRRPELAQDFLARSLKDASSLVRGNARPIREDLTPLGHLLLSSSSVASLATPLQRMLEAAFARSDPKLNSQCSVPAFDADTSFDICVNTHIEDEAAQSVVTDGRDMVGNDDITDFQPETFAIDFDDYFPEEREPAPVQESLEMESVTFDDESIDKPDDDNSERPDWSQRTRKMFHFLSAQLPGKDDEVILQDLLAQKSRSTVAAILIETLILKTHDYIQIQQDGAYENIHISRAARFHEPIPEVQLDQLTIAA